MAKRVALIPEELVSSYHLQKPEIRIEDEIESLLEKTNFPDDMKVKLLSGLITRYHKTVHAPPEPVRVSVVNEHEELGQKSELITSSENDAMIKDIMFTVPQRFSKYIPMIAEKLQSRRYSWNKWGEFMLDGKPIKGTKIVDLFSYIMRNVKKQEEPKHFAFFLKAIKEINIPRSWIANEKVLARLNNNTQSSDFLTSDTEKSDSYLSFDTDKRNSRTRSVKEGRNISRPVRVTSRSVSPNRKWLEY